MGMGYITKNHWKNEAWFIFMVDSDKIAIFHGGSLSPMKVTLDINYGMKHEN